MSKKIWQNYSHEAVTGQRQSLSLVFEGIRGRCLKFVLSEGVLLSSSVDFFSPLIKKMPECYHTNTQVYWYGTYIVHTANIEVNARQLYVGDKTRSWSNLAPTPICLRRNHKNFVPIKAKSQNINSRYYLKYGSRPGKTWTCADPGCSSCVQWPAPRTEEWRTSRHIISSSWVSALLDRIHSNSRLQVSWTRRRIPPHPTSSTRLRSCFLGRRSCTLWRNTAWRFQRENSGYDQTHWESEWSTFPSPSPPPPYVMNLKNLQNNLIHHYSPPMETQKMEGGARIREQRARSEDNLIASSDISLVGCGFQRRICRNRNVL